MAPTTSTTSPPAKAKKPRKKKDPNAPAGVTSAYTWFFRATQATIKEKNPGAKFGDISKIVASMWEALGDNEKTQYKKQNEEDKIRHKREMEAYNAGVSFKKTPIKVKIFFKSVWVGKINGVGVCAKCFTHVSKTLPKLFT